jgi:hypothetical protein
MGAVVTSAQLDGQTVPFTRRQYFGRPFVRRTIEFPPQARRTYELVYDVPAAATRTGDRLTYRLDLTPQGMITPQAVTVRVRWPRGYDVGELPSGWTRRGRRVTYANPALDTQPSFTITGSRAGSGEP